MGNTAKKLNLKVLNSLALKIIAVVAMTIDHIGFFFFPIGSNSYEVLRIIGRLALPLFCFLSTQGAIHSRNNFIYALKLIVLGVAIDLVYYLFSKQYIGNALTSLGFGVLALSLILKKNKLSFLAIPVIVVSILTDFSFFPIRMDGGAIAMLLMLAYLFAEKGADMYLTYLGKKNEFSDEGIVLMKKDILRQKQNILAFVMTFVVYILFMFADMWQLNQYPVANILPFKVESYGVIASVLLLFYNGKRGYNNKILNISFYAYYPLHVALLYLIASLL